MSKAKLLKDLTAVMEAAKTKLSASKLADVPGDNYITHFGQENLGEYLGYVASLELGKKKIFEEGELEGLAGSAGLASEDLASRKLFHYFLFELHRQKAHSAATAEVQDIKHAKKSRVGYIDVSSGNSVLENWTASYSRARNPGENSQGGEFVIGATNQGGEWENSAQVPSLLQKQFQEMGVQIRNYCIDKREYTGSTAIAAHYSKDQKLTIANLGDSRAVLFVKKADGTVAWIRLTNDQEPNDVFEQARIEAKGGFVNEDGGKYKVAGSVTERPGLAFARSFGDVFTQAGFTDRDERLISYEPDIYQHDIAQILLGCGDNSEAFLMTSCNGMYDHGIGNEATYAKALKDWFSNAEGQQEKWKNNMAEYLRVRAIALGSRQNVTVCVSDITKAPQQSVVTAVFDGHNGNMVSAIAAKAFAQNVLQEDRNLISEAIVGVARIKAIFNGKPGANGSPELKAFAEIEDYKVAEDIWGKATPIKIEETKVLKKEGPADPAEVRSKFESSKGPTAGRKPSPANLDGPSNESKSEFTALEFSSQTGAEPFYDFISTKSEALKKVPVALAGTITVGWWQIAGSGMNGQMESHLKKMKGNVLGLANAELKKNGPQKEDGAENAIGTVQLLDLAQLLDPTQIEGFKKGSQVQKILYSVSPSLEGKNQEAAKAAMNAFGKKFRIQLSEKKITELCLPLYSGGIYSGGHSQKNIAEWLMEGWLAAEKESPTMKKVKVYLGHPCLVKAVAKLTKPAIESPKLTPPVSKGPSKLNLEKAVERPLSFSAKAFAEGDKAQWIAIRKLVTEERARAINPAENLGGAFFTNTLKPDQRRVIDRRLALKADLAGGLENLLQQVEKGAAASRYEFQERAIPQVLLEGVISDYRAELNVAFEESLKKRSFDEGSFSRKEVANKYQVKTDEAEGQLEIDCGYYYDLRSDFPSFLDELPRTKPFIGFAPIEGEPSDELVRGFVTSAIQGWYSRGDDKPNNLDELHTQNKKAYFFINEAAHWLSVEIIFKKNASGENEVEVNYSNPSGGKESGCSKFAESFIKKIAGCLQGAVEKEIIGTVEAGIVAGNGAKAYIPSALGFIDVSEATNVKIIEKHLLEQATAAGCGPTAKANLALLMGDKVRIGKVEISKSDIDGQGMMLLPEDELRLRLQDYYEILKFDEAVKESRCGVERANLGLLENLSVIKDYLPPVGAAETVGMSKVATKIDRGDLGAARAAAEEVEKIEEQRYQESLLEDEFYGELTRPLTGNEIANGALNLAAGIVNYQQIEAVNKLPQAERLNTPLWLKRSQPDRFKNDEFIGEDVQAYYRYLFTTKYPQAGNFADYGAVGIVQGADDLLADRMAETIRKNKWGFYSYSTGGHWVLIVVSPDKQVTYLNSMGRGQIGMNQVIQADINRAFKLARQQQSGKTHSYGLSTQVGVQCGLHSVLAAEEILKAVVASPHFSMEEVLRKCQDLEDPLHKKPSGQEILTVRWNASSEQFKNQRENAYQRVIATKESLLGKDASFLVNLQGSDLEPMYRSGDLTASEVAAILGVELTEEGKRIVKEIRELKEARESDRIKGRMELSGEELKASGPKKEEEEGFSLDRIVSSYFKEVARLTRKSALTLADDVARSTEILDLSSLYRRAGEWQFLERINEEKTKEAISEELKKLEEERGADLENLEALKANLEEARRFLSEASSLNIGLMKKDAIVTETLGIYEECLRAGTLSDRAEFLLEKILKYDEYSRHKIGSQIINQILEQGSSLYSELTETEAISGSPLTYPVVGIDGVVIEIDPGTVLATEEIGAIVSSAAIDSGVGTEASDELAEPGTIAVTGIVKDAAFVKEVEPVSVIGAESDLLAEGEAGDLGRDEDSYETDGDGDGYFSEYSDNEDDEELDLVEGVGTEEDFWEGTDLGGSPLGTIIGNGEAVGGALTETTSPLIYEEDGDVHGGVEEREPDIIIGAPFNPSPHGDSGAKSAGLVDEIDSGGKAETIAEAVLSPKEVADVRGAISDEIYEEVDEGGVDGHEELVIDIDRAIGAELIGGATPDPLLGHDFSVDRAKLTKEGEDGSCPEEVKNPSGPKTWTKGLRNGGDEGFNPAKNLPDHYEPYPKANSGGRVNRRPFSLKRASRRGLEKAVEETPNLGSEIERMKVEADGKITLDFKNSETGESDPVVIKPNKNKFVEVVKKSEGPEVRIKSEDFRKELMDYYEKKGDYKVSGIEEERKIGKEALEVLNIYRAVPSTSSVPKNSVLLNPESRIVVGGLSKMPKTSVALTSASRIVVVGPSKPR
jgi:serine/threonine protein phosphatase PrpC